MIRARSITGEKRMNLSFGCPKSYVGSTVKWWRRDSEKRNKFVLVIGLFTKTRVARFTKGEVALAKTMGCDGIARMDVANYRAATLDKLLAADVEPCHQFNIENIAVMASDAVAVLIRRADVPPPLRGYVERVFAEIEQYAPRVPMIDVFDDDDEIDPALLDGAVLTSQIAIPSRP